MSNCDHNCDACKSKCDQDTSLKAPLNPNSNIKKVIAVVSGKGGVGKSLVTGLLAVSLNRLGNKVGIIDADITGPSIPKMFGVKGKLYQNDKGIIPLESENKIKMISANFILEHDNDPIVWRSPLISGLVKQFWSNVHWGDIDYMLVDCPPGTGDVPLTVFQSLNVDGIVIVTSPQELVSVIVEKAIKMAQMMNVPIIGIVENMSYVECPKCNEIIYPFGNSKIENVAKKFNTTLLTRLPINPNIASSCDNGKIEDLQFNYFDSFINKL